jgi:hypothetical protein
MDITDSTKALILKAQALKTQHQDHVSQVFIDFYCQCRQGMDYLFPEGVRETVRLLDILQWFCNCVDQGEPSTIIRLMWKDVVGPTLEEYQADELIEAKLLNLFEQGDLKEGIRQWDLERRADGGVNLTLKTVLAELHDLEIAAAQSQQTPT